jgi:hypothetical protein
MNEINERNFNETCKGYILRALKITHENDKTNDNNLTKRQEERIMNGLEWALDEMTFEDARMEKK